MSATPAIRAEHLGKRYRLGRAGGSRATRARRDRRRRRRACSAGVRRGAAPRSAERRSSGRSTMCRSRSRPGEIGRHHRPQRRGQVHAAEGAVADHRADDRLRGGHGARRVAARGGHRVSRGSDRPREHLSERRDSRHEAARRSTASSTRSSRSPKSTASSTRRSSTTRAACTCGSPSRWPRISKPRFSSSTKCWRSATCSSRRSASARWTTSPGTAARCCSSATTWKRFSGCAREGMLLDRGRLRRQRFDRRGRRAVPHRRAHGSSTSAASTRAAAAAPVGRESAICGSSTTTASRCAGVPAEDDLTFEHRSRARRTRRRAAPASAGSSSSSSICSDQGQPLSSLMNVDDDGVELPSATTCRGHRAARRVRRFIPGRYRLNAFVGIPYLEHVDEIPDALEFEMLPPEHPWRPVRAAHHRGRSSAARPSGRAAVSPATVRKPHDAAAERPSHSRSDVLGRRPGTATPRVAANTLRRARQPVVSADARRARRRSRRGLGGGAWCARRWTSSSG